MISLQKTTISVNKLIDEWIEYKSITVKNSTLTKYAFITDSYIRPLIGENNSYLVNTDTINIVFSDSKVNSLSSSTMESIYMVFASIVKYGISKKYIKPFVFPSRNFKKEQNNIKYISRKDENIIIDYLLKNINIKTLSILITIFTGLRVGEVSALKWEDIDFDNKLLSIKRTVTRIKNTDINSNSKTKLVINLPKSKSSVRTIPLPNFIIEILTPYKDDNNKFIFSKDGIVPKDPRTIQKTFDKILKELNLEHINFHMLRHSFATRLREENVDIKAISELLGHHSFLTTQSIYIHSSDEYKRKSVEMLYEKVYKNNS